MDFYRNSIQIRIFKNIIILQGIEFILIYTNYALFNYNILILLENS